MFNRNVFTAAFSASLDALQQSEHVTKRELKALSRSVLEATHETGDIAFVNQLIAVLTPVNKKTAIIFFKEFTGFQWDDEKKVFTKKSKKHYDACHALYVEFMADPNNNIWSWAERNINVEKKPFDVSKVTSFIQGALKHADQKAVMLAVIKAGIEIDAIIAVMGEMGFDAEMNDPIEDAPF